MEILRLVVRLLLITLLIVIGSKVIYKDDYAIINGSLTLSSGNASATIDYPSGFTKNNCVVLSFETRKNDLEADYGFGYGYFEGTSAYGMGAVGHGIRLNSQNILVKIQNPVDGSHNTGDATFDYKIVLMKVESDISSFEEGDINMDGSINQSDKTLLQSYLSGTGTLTEKQFALADMNSDGKLDSADLLLLQQKINSNT